MKVLLIDNYDSFTYNLYQYIEELGGTCHVVRNDRIDLAGVERLRPDRIVISPGPGHPKDSGISLDILNEVGARTPVLGVCLGHQAIGLVFGGKVMRAPTLMHGKVSEIRHDGRGIYRGIKGSFSATRYHSLIVERKSLPKCLKISAETPDGIVMGLRHRRLPIEGVQFHPESIMTTEGKALIRNFLKGRG